MEGRGGAICLIWTLTPIPARRVPLENVDRRMFRSPLTGGSGRIHPGQRLQPAAVTLRHAPHAKVPAMTSATRTAQLTVTLHTEQQGNVQGSLNCRPSSTNPSSRLLLRTSDQAWLSLGSETKGHASPSPWETWDRGHHCRHAQPNESSPPGSSPCAESKEGSREVVRSCFFL